MRHLTAVVIGSLFLGLVIAAMGLDSNSATVGAVGGYWMGLYIGGKE